MTTSERWVSAIKNACAEPDVARSNHLITMLHYLLSEAMADAMGREGGPNFHSWAVWGSQKAGVTIRQEDLDSATVHGTAWASIAGSVAGAVSGVFAGHWLGWLAAPLPAAIGAGMGALIAGWAGKQLAMRLRGKAAWYLLQGNRTVIEEIGEQTARFLELLEGGATAEGRSAFFAGLRPGPTEGNGQDRLATAFRAYLAALDSNDMETKRAAMIAGNCATVYHEHIRLEPYIRGAMPLVLRRCATRRWMTYKIGERRYSVSDDLPGIATSTAAKNWTKIEERMRYVFALFGRFHNAPEVFATPYPEMKMATNADDPLAGVVL
jgi:hypothetical protein